ncbi:ABC-type Fe3+ transport system, permease component [Actinobacteria bacterium IMCC26207]|nr:ABC-type Fe3+ transport system, permease component [Actinobacteria bacterium IMCC26207]
MKFLSDQRPAGHQSLRPSAVKMGHVSRVGVIVVTAVLLMIALPISAVLLRAIRPDGVWSAEAVTRILSSPRTWRLIAVTVAQALVSCACTVAVGVPVAWVLSRFRFYGRSFVKTLATVPFVLPTVVIGAAFATLLGPRGLFEARGTWLAIVIAQVCFNLAVVIRTVGAALSGVDSNQEAAARMLGASPFQAARRVLLPTVLPAIAASAVVVFLFCFTSFGVIVMLGGGSVTTVEVEIWTRATRQFDISGAGVLCGVQLVAVLATLSIHSRISKRRAVSSVFRARRSDRLPRSVAEWAAVVAAVGAVVMICGLPIAALFERSLRVGTGLGLANWQHLGSVTAGTGLSIDPLSALWRSLLTASAAATAALLLGVLAARVIAQRPGGAADRILLLPLGVSATTLGLGLLLIGGRPPLDLRGSLWLVPIAQMLVAIPLVVRAVLPALQALPASLGESGQLLGAGSIGRFWRIELPSIRSAVFAGAGLGFVACLGEFGATVFLVRAASPTAPVAIERLLSRPAAAGFGQAMALSCILVLLCGGVLLAVDYLAAGDEGLDLAF